MSPEPDFTLLLPCLDEAATLPACLAQARRAVAELGLAAEILVADNGSRDGSVELAGRLGARVVEVSARGYGQAVRGGIQAARGRWVIMADADDSYDWSALAPFVAKLRDGADLVMGCRFPSGGGRIAPGAMPWLHRWLGNPALSFLGRRLFRIVVRDFNCGLRGFDRRAIQRLDLRAEGMELAAEMVAKSALAGLRINQVPVLLRPAGRSRPPHLRSWSDGWLILRLLLRLAPPGRPFSLLLPPLLGLGLGLAYWLGG